MGWQHSRLLSPMQVAGCVQASGGAGREDMHDIDKQLTKALWCCNTYVVFHRVSDTACAGRWWCWQRGHARHRQAIDQGAVVLQHICGFPPCERHRVCRPVVVLAERDKEGMDKHLTKALWCCNTHMVFPTV